MILYEWFNKVRYNLVSERCVLLNCIVLRCAHGFLYNVVIFFSTMVSFGNAHLEKKSKRWGSQPWVVI